MGVVTMYVWLVGGIYGCGYNVCVASGWNLWVWLQCMCG